MKNLNGKWSILLVVALTMQLLLTPALAVDEKSEKNDLYSNDLSASEIYEELAGIMREHYEKMGYTEVAYTATLSEICDMVNIDAEVYTLANMDIETAPPEMKADILAARNKIIFSTDEWYADSAGIIVAKVDHEKKEWYEVPKFSELFPGWDLPKNTVNNVETVDNSDISPALIEPLVVFNDDVKLVAPPATGPTDPFKVWNVPSGIYFTTLEVKALKTSETINLGISDMTKDTPEEVFQELRATKGHVIELFVHGGRTRKAGFRASTYSYPGSATIEILAEKQ